MEQLMLMQNPRRRKSHRRNPAWGGKSLPLVGNIGVGLPEILGTSGGLVAAVMIPNLIIKPTAPATTLTTTQKWLKIGIAAGVAVGIGYLGKSLKMGGNISKAAVAGGLGGVVIQGVSMLVPALKLPTIGQGALALPPAYHFNRGLGVPVNIPAQPDDLNIITNVT